MNQVLWWKRAIKRAVAALIGYPARPILRFAYGLLPASYKKTLWRVRQWAHPPIHIAPAQRAAAYFDGWRVIVNISEMTGGDVFYGLARLDEAERRILKTILRHGDTMFDVGANIGLYTLSAMHVVGNEGRIIAFEPSTATRSLLSETLARNRIHTVTVESYALSDRDGYADLFLNSQSGCTSLGNTQRGTVYGTERIVLKTLDRYVEEHAINKIDLIKIDVEGFEVDVLRGAEKTLRAQDPVLFIECDAKNAGSVCRPIDDVHALLERLGFRMWCVDRSRGALTPAAFYQEAYPGINFVCARPSNKRL